MIWIKAFRAKDPPLFIDPDGNESTVDVCETSPTSSGTIIITADQAHNMVQQLGDMMGTTFQEKRELTWTRKR